MRASQEPLLLNGPGTSVTGSELPRRDSLRRVLTHFVYEGNYGMEGLAVSAAAILVLVLWGEVSGAVLALWLLAIAVVEASSWLVTRAYFRVQSPCPRVWQRHFATCYLAQGAVWGSSALFLLWPLREQSALLTGAILLGNCAVMLNTMSSFPVLYRGFVILATGPFTALMILQPPLIASSTAAGVVAGVISLRLILLSRRLFHSRIQGIRSQLAFNRLHHHLDAERKRRRIAQTRLLQASDFDAVTGLPKQTHFFKRTDRLLSAQQAVPPTHRRNIIIVLIDLDGFTQINHDYGRLAGDHVLRQVAARLRATLPTSASISRLGDDEFAVAVPLPLGVTESKPLLREIRSAVEDCIEWRGQPLWVSCSVGVSVAPEHGNDVDNLLRKANLALRQAKLSSGPRQLEFRPYMETAITNRLSVRQALQRALSNGEFRLVYQPVIGLADGRVVAAEALLRWRSKEHGEISPAEFIPLAEQYGLINEIGAWTLNEACRQAAYWHRHLRRLAISVNVSVHQLMDERFRHMVAKALRDHELPGRYLRLEITESVIMSDPTTVLHLIEQIRRLDVQIALDDFGTGYSSLSYLAQLDLDYLKLDKSLIQDIGESRRASAIVQTTVALADALDLTLVAEGIETAAQWRHLRDQGCPYGQGFYFSPGVSPQAFERLPSHYTLPGRSAARLEPAS